MSRLPRIIVENIPHHVVQRGNHSQKVFFSGFDKTLYMGILREAALKYGVAIWAYCLMDNHVHLVCVPKIAQGLSKCFQETNHAYSQRINAREGWKGGMWESRFKSYPMGEIYLKAAVRYVELNPVKAGMVRLAQDYEFSSARAHVLKVADKFLDYSFLVDEIPDWDDFLRDGMRQDGVVEEHLKTGRPLGDADFIKVIEKKLGRELGAQRPGRKPKSFHAQDMDQTVPLEFAK